MTPGPSASHRALVVKRLVAWMSFLALVIGMASALPAQAVGATRADAGEARSAQAASAYVDVETSRGDPLLAADLSKFKAGSIISDSAFFNRATMTASQIQAFLEAKVPRCEPGYTCLKDWYDTSRTTTADPMCGAYSGGVRERASVIIYKVAQACGINPQVLLVMLQKEQALVTHVWPSDWRFTIAMGQGCPDTAGCDTRYYGFFNQVYGAAWQMKRYANPPGTSQYFTWYAPGNTWNIRYSPNVDCGSGPVFIQNQATANLYYYTPYQPNAAALRAGYGEGDACSAYGNRNFYNYFTDWFGSTPGPVITTLDTAPHVTALTADGTLLAYAVTRDGRWGTAVITASDLAGARQALAVGDLDGDGRRDVITVGAGNRATFSRGDGRTGYLAAQPLGVDWSNEALMTAAGDFDRDGVPDVLTTSSAGVLRLWRGIGTGGLRAPVSFGSGWDAMNLISGGVDMTGDGNPDLIARDRNGALLLYPGNGIGGWLSRSVIGTGWGDMTAIFSPGDISGDGVADVLARDASGNLLRFGGNRTGFLFPGRIVGPGWQDMVSLTGDGPLATGVRVLPAGVGDVDGDRMRDVIARSQDGSLYVYRGDGRGGWRGASVADPKWGAATSFVVLGDFTGDGVHDLGGISPDGAFALRPGTGTGGFAPAAVIGSGWGSLSLLMGGIDFDGDRKPDVIGRTSNGDLLLYRGNGAGGWAAGPVVVGSGWNSFDRIFYAGDFDGDKAADVIGRRTDGTLWLYPTTGTGAWLAPRQIGSGWSDMTELFSAGDFDGRGAPDVLARGKDGSLYLYRANGAGGWSGSVVIGSGWNGMLQIG